jgi:hypothetical protein
MLGVRQASHAQFFDNAKVIASSLSFINYILHDCLTQTCVASRHDRSMLVPPRLRPPPVPGYVVIALKSYREHSQQYVRARHSPRGLISCPCFSPWSSMDAAAGDCLGHHVWAKQMPVEWSLLRGPTPDRF